MSRRLLGVDVDLCVCPSDIGWQQHLVPCQWVTEGGLPYDLGSLFPEHKDPYEYWRELDYSQFKPLNNSVESLEELSQHFDIVFISSVKGNHWKSKVNWLKEHFPFSVGYMATKEKHLMNGSVVAMIDDRMSQLKGFDKEKRILFNTPYTQDVQCEVEMSFGVWSDQVVNKICSRYL